MTPTTTQPLPRPERIIGRHVGEADGPTLLVVAAIHGNEPAGIEAARSVLEELAERRPPFRGRLVAIVGNRTAVARRVRFVDVDLNRAWTPLRLNRVRTGDPSIAHQTETSEQRELLPLLEEIALEGSGRLRALDLHTSSSRGAPFATVGDTLRNRIFARRFPVPLVLGIEEQIDGGLLEYLNNRGHITMGFEAGQHDDPDSVLRHRAFIWVALAAAGCIAESDISDPVGIRELLRAAAPGIPPIVEVCYRHALKPEDGFVMNPGWSHFQPVRRREILARDRRGDIRARQAGLVLLPLYQTHGDDGFFIGRRVRPLWLRVSSLLRRLKAHRLVHLLPGVTRSPTDSYVVHVDRRVARYYAVDIFHLLGYRKRREQNRTVVFERRRE